jgi:hypothetical protein
LTGVVLRWSPSREVYLDNAFVADDVDLESMRGEAEEGVKENSTSTHTTGQVTDNERFILFISLVARTHTDFERVVREHGSVDG